VILLVVGTAWPAACVFVVRKWKADKKHRKASKISKLGHAYAHFKDGFMWQLMLYSSVFRLFVAARSFYLALPIVGWVLIAIPNLSLMAFQIKKAPLGSSYLNKVEPVRLFTETLIGLTTCFLAINQPVLSYVIPLFVLAIAIAIFVARTIPMVKKAKLDAQKTSKFLQAMVKSKLVPKFVESQTVSKFRQAWRKSVTNDVLDASLPIEYKVTVTTGSHFTAGTSSNIWVKLHGADSDSDFVPLGRSLLQSDPNKGQKAAQLAMLGIPLAESEEQDLFERNTVNAFLITVTGLGKLNMVTLQMDDVGSAWYCESVKVEYSSFAELFPVQDWLKPVPGSMCLKEAVGLSRISKVGTLDETKHSGVKKDPTASELTLEPKSSTEDAPLPDGKYISDSESGSESESDSDPELDAVSAVQSRYDKVKSLDAGAATDDPVSPAPNKILRLLAPELCLRADDREAYMCGICFLLLRDPMIMNNGGDAHGYRNCGHGPYCSACLFRAFKTSGNFCPDCRQPTTVDQLVYDARTARFLRSVEVRCANHDGGCSWEGEVRDWDQHMLSCSFAVPSADAPSDDPSTAASPAPTEPTEHPFGLNLPPPLPPVSRLSSRPWSASDADAAPRSSAGSRGQALTDRRPESCGSSDQGERLGRSRSRGSSGLAVSRSRSPYAADNQWQPIDLSEAIATLPEDLRLKPPSPLLSSRSSSSCARIPPVFDEAALKPGLQLPPHMLSLFARLSTPEDTPKLAGMSDSERRRTLTHSARCAPHRTAYYRIARTVLACLCHRTAPWHAHRAALEGRALLAVWTAVRACDVSSACRGLCTRAALPLGGPPCPGIGAGLEHCREQASRLLMEDEERRSRIDDLKRKQQERAEVTLAPASLLPCTALRRLAGGIVRVCVPLTGETRDRLCVFD
jgi:hypothetical protein